MAAIYEYGLSLIKVFPVTWKLVVCCSVSNLFQHNQADFLDLGFIKDRICLFYEKVDLFNSNFQWDLSL